ncbi:MAG: DUF3566 domain-containing protein [Jatrophihabitans sp.]|uniref:DUF3566 domain-containing protein n=1 Tax=Jatrophihabitans sp. TaxID=1932789 RepID=UPI003F7FA77F
MARSERSDRDPGKSSGRGGGTPGSRPGRVGSGGVGGTDATTGTIPPYSPSFPEPDFDLANRAAASASAGAPTTRPAEDEFPRGSDRQRPEDGASSRRRPRRPRRAQLQLRHINPWTVLRFSCVLAIALFFVWLIVVGVLYGVLDAAGVIHKINNAVTTINGDGSTPPIRASIVFGGAAIIGVVNMILFIALSTIGSVVYNLCADLVGGIEITLSEA